MSQSSRDYTPLEMLKTPVFWILYVMFVLVAASGLDPTRPHRRPRILYRMAIRAQVRGNSRP